MDLNKRFMEFVSINSKNGCWEWDGVIRMGYGRFSKDGRMQTAHRVSWEIHHGPILGYLVLHKCDNKCCVNPEHLFLGTQRDNVRDMVNHRIDPEIVMGDSIGFFQNSLTGVGKEITCLDKMISPIRGDDNYSFTFPDM